MNETLHELDPDRDFVLLLYKASTSFAVWIEDLESGSLGNISAQDNLDLVIARPAVDSGDLETAVTEPIITLSNEDPQPSDTETDLSTLLFPDSTIYVPEEQSEVHFRVSSKHLILSSHYFKTMLKGPWKEADPLWYHQIEAEDFDEDTFLTVMYLIHGRHRSVPKILNLEQLAKTAVIIDYYECHEVAEPYIEI